MIKLIIASIKIRILKWCIRDMDCTYGDIFNAARINALIGELVDNGVISESKYNKRLADTVCSMIGQEV